MEWHEDPEMCDWLMNAVSQGGGFVTALSEAAMHADPQNYVLLRPVLLQFKRKYPRYSEVGSVHS